MDYEQKYTEALEKIREGLQPLQDGTKISGVTRAFLEEVFPELKESEDERIRKMIINHLTQERGSLSNDEAAEAIAWLEKQGEQKPIWSKEDEIGFNDTFWAIQQARTIAKDENDMGNLWYAEDWLKSLKERLS